jgi:chitinase
MLTLFVSGMVEVGSNSMYCNNNKYQAACCTVSPSISATKLYNQCSWADWPLCDNGICSNTEIVSSTTGSGGAECNVRSYSPKTHELAVQERKYCCDATDDNSKWEDCQWYNDIGFGPAGRSWSEDNYCLSGCPPDRVRVGMDKYGGGCVGKGGRSKCCLPKLQTVTKQLDGRDENYASDLLDFLDQPTCDYDAFNEGWWKKRDFGNSSIELRK